MTGQPSVPTEFDPAVDGLPEALDPSRLPEQGAGRVVTLLSSATSDQNAWARDSAVAVAQAWAEQGVRVFLADLGLERPTLHETLGVPNEEGLSDLFRFGASVQRVAHRVGDLPFFFTAAGSPIFGSEEVLRNERWRILIDGFAEAGAALLLYLPADEAGADAVLARTTELVVLGAEVPEDLLGDGVPSPLAWVAWPGATPAAVAPEGIDPEPEGGFVDPAVSERSDLTVEAPGWSHDSSLLEGDEEGLGDVPGDPASEFGSDLEATDWGEVLESADTQSFDVPGREAETEPDAEEPFWDPSPGDWEEVAPGLEIDPDLGGSFEDLGAPSVGADAGLAAEGEQADGETDAEILSAEGSDTPGSPDEDGLDASLPEVGEGATEVPTDSGWSEEASISPPAADRPAEEWAGAPESPIQDDAQPATAGPTPRRGRRWVLWGGAAAIVILGAWQLTGSGFLAGDGAGGAGGEPPPEGEVAAPDPSAPETAVVEAADVDPGEPTSPLLDASLVIQSFPSASEAQDFADRLSENLGDLLFTVVPSLINGQTWYRTVAGPARDVSEIPGIQERIQRANLSMLAGRSGWFPRRTGLAFLLTEEPDLSDADALAVRYRGEGIPAYVLAIDYSAGIRRYRVYAGGYAFEDESAPLARILSDAGVDAELVPRLGSMPSGR